MTERVQTMFGGDGEVTKTLEGLTAAQQKRYVEMLKRLEVRGKEKAICPWCFFVGTLREFSQTSKTFDVLKTCRCPRCDQGMRERTTRLVDNLGPQDYSEWLWEQVFQWHAYEKVSWEHLKQGVKDMGFSSTFWNVWRRMKEGRETQTPYQTKDFFRRSKDEYLKGKYFSKKLGEQDASEDEDKES